MIATFQTSFLSVCFLVWTFAKMRKIRILKKYWNFFGHVLKPDLSLVTFFELVFKIFTQVCRTCCHLMLNVSWDAIQRPKIRKFWVKIFIDSYGYKPNVKIQIFNYTSIFWLHTLKPSIEICWFYFFFCPQLGRFKKSKISQF